MPEESNLPIQSQSNALIKTAGLIKVTNKLLSESDFEFYGDFKGNTVWEIDTKTQDADCMKVFVPKYDGYFLTYGKGYFYFWSKETGMLLRETYLGNMDNICLMECEEKQLWHIDEAIQIFSSSPQIGAINKGKISIDYSGSFFPFDLGSFDEPTLFIWLSFNKDKVLSYSRDHQIRIWDIETLTEIKSFELEYFKVLKENGLLSPDKIACCPISYRDNKHVIIVTTDGFLQNWNTENGMIETQIVIDNWIDIFRRAAFNKVNGDLAIWNSHAKSIFFLSIEHEEEWIISLTGMEHVCDLEFSSDGNYLFVLTTFEGLKIYETKTYSLIVNCLVDMDFSEDECDYPTHMGIDHSRKEIYVSTEKGMLYKIN